MAVAIAGAGFVAVAALYIYGAHGFSLSEPDEARYAEIAREMLVRGDWVTPHLNFVKYFEKPPLVSWGTAVAFLAFGQNELAARLPSVLSGLLTVAIVVGLATRMYGAPTALLVLPILALGPLFGLLAQVLTLDMTLTFFMTLAMAGVWCGWDGGRGIGAAAPRGWYRLAYAATALAVLVKGPVAAVLVGGGAGLFLVLHGGWRALRPLCDWRGVALALLVAGPWFMLVAWRNPEFLHFFVVDQHIARYLWTTEHGEPIWFFAPPLLLALGPWSLLLLCDPPLIRAALGPREWAPATRFLVIWAAVIVAFFSLSTSKLLTYILPAVPPLALLAARAIALGWAHGRLIGLWRLGWLLLIGGPVMSLCGAVIPLFNHHWRMPIIAPRLLVGGPVLLLTGWLVRRALSRGRSGAALAVLAVGWFALLVVAVDGRGAANDYRVLGLAARAAMRPDDRLAVYRHFTQGIPFYAQRRVVLVGGIGELKFGSQQGDHSAWFWKGDDELRREWSGPGRLFVVINRHELERINPPLDPAPVALASKDKKVLIVNR